MKPAVSTAALLVLLAAATASRAEEGRAPLAESKRELQQLKTDRAGTGAPGAKDGLKTSAPALHLPAPSAPRPSAQQQQRSDLQRKEAGRNWLLDGVARLEGESRTMALLPGETDPDHAADDAIIDTSDPAYLLKLYDQQGKSADAQSAQNKDQHAPRPDAFAPFLKDWMANSPVNDQLLGDLVRRNAGTPAGGGPVLGEPPIGVRGAAALPDFSRAPTGPAVQANPYLAGPAASIQRDGFSPLLAAPGGAPVPGPVLAGSPPAALGPKLVPEPAATDRKAPPPSLTDDKKYFPQLNRF